MKALLTLLAAGKLGKVLLTGGTMVLSVFAYAFVFGLWYAVGFVLLIFVHEMGHFLAARQRGLAVGAPTFIPFVGAWIELKEMPHDVETLIAAPQVMKAWRFDPNAPENAAYYSVAPAKRFEYALYYVALAAFLAVMSFDVHEMLEQLQLR